MTPLLNAEILQDLAFAFVKAEGDPQLFLGEVVRTHPTLPAADLAAYWLIFSSGITLCMETFAQILNQTFCAGPLGDGLYARRPQWEDVSPRINTGLYPAIYRSWKNAKQVGTETSPRRAGSPAGEGQGAEQAAGERGGRDCTIILFPGGKNGSKAESPAFAPKDPGEVG